MWLKIGMRLDVQTEEDNCLWLIIRCLHLQTIVSSNKYISKRWKKPVSTIEIKVNLRALTICHNWLDTLASQQMEVISCGQTDPAVLEECLDWSQEAGTAWLK